MGTAVYFFPFRTGSKLGISPLMLAAMNGHVPAVKLLLDMGSDINAQIETNRNTALTLACFQGRAEVVSLLLDRKANVEHRAKVSVRITFPYDLFPTGDFSESSSFFKFSCYFEPLWAQRTYLIRGLIQYSEISLVFFFFLNKGSINDDELFQ